LGAHATQDGHPFAFDEVERVGGCEPGKEPTRCAEDRRGEVCGPQAEPERRRDEAREDVIAREAAGFDRELVEVEPPVLGVDHDLREAGRSRGGVEHEHVVGPEGPARDAGGSIRLVHSLQPLHVVERDLGCGAGALE
jgi:hypothetical protein